MPLFEGIKIIFENAFINFLSLFIIFISFFFNDIVCRVANTDNTSIIGITMDYGPFGFMDYYDPSYISQSHGK